MRKASLHRWSSVLLVTALLGLVGTAFSPQAAYATHTQTACNSDTGNMDEIYVEWHGVLFVGVDTGLSDTGRAVCVVALTIEENLLIDILDPQPGSPGLALRLRRCTGGCTEAVLQTGIEVNTTAPLFSCIWVNGTQQNPGCPS